MRPRLVVLDVGQGDALIAHNPQTRRAVMIDCAFSGASRASEYLAGNQVRRLDAVIVTHLDADHYGGVAQLLRTVPTDVLAYGLAKGHGKANPSVDAFARGMLAAMKQSDSKHLRPVDGEVVEVPGIRIEMLGPSSFEEVESVAANNANAASVMMRLEVGDLTAILAGDCPSTRWRRAVSDHRSRLRADVFVLPHHGAKHTPAPHSLTDILDLVVPSVIVLTVGSANRYGHPHPETLETVSRWAHARGARLVCTQLNELCRIGRAAKGARGVRCAGEIVVEHDRAAPIVLTPQQPNHAAFVQIQEAPRCAPTSNPA